MTVLDGFPVVRNGPVGRPAASLEDSPVPSYVPLLDDALPTATLHVSAWADPVLDRVGHDPRSAYVEQFWLGILGPSTTLPVCRANG